MSTDKSIYNAGLYESVTDYQYKRMNTNQSSNYQKDNQKAITKYSFDHLYAMNQDSSTNLYKVIYENSGLNSRRPFKYSICRVMLYKETQRLLLFGVAHWTAAQLTLLLDRPDTPPVKPVHTPSKPGLYYSNQEYLLLGCLFGLIILAILTTFTLKRMMFFLPLFILVTVQTVYRLTVFIL